MMEEIVALGKPVVLVLMAGSPLSVTWAAEHVPAIVDVWYPGETGGTALAEVLFGDYSPAGRLPITFPRSTDDLPPIGDYAMKGRTYRYLEKEPLYPFGYGLSYTSFAYTELSLSTTRLSTEQNLELRVTVQNTGKRDGDEVVQLYVQDEEASVAVPHRALKGFVRVHLKAGERREVSFTLTPHDLSLIDESGRRVLEPGRFRVTVGGSQPDARSVALMGREPLSAEFAVTGDARALPY
jgi:beta-glucosidase